MSDGDYMSKDMQDNKILDESNVKKYYPFTRRLLKSNVGYIKTVDNISL